MTESDVASPPYAPAGAILGLAMWLFCLWLGSSVAVLTAGSRVGVSADTTYADAGRAFHASWGGWTTVSPPSFWLTRKFQSRVIDPTLKAWITVDQTEDIPLLPYDVALTTSLHKGSQRSGGLSFDGFSAVFLLPIYKGVAFLAYMFLLGLTVLVPVARQNVARWPIIVGWAPLVGK